MLPLVSKIEDSIKVQDSSVQMMTFLVQDFLDFAQMKAGSFRKNIAPFNVREAVTKVMNL